MFAQSSTALKCGSRPRQTLSQRRRHSRYSCLHVRRYVRRSPERGQASVRFADPAEGNPGAPCPISPLARSRLNVNFSSNVHVFGAFCFPASITFACFRVVCQARPVPKVRSRSPAPLREGQLVTIATRKLGTRGHPIGAGVHPIGARATPQVRSGVSVSSAPSVHPIGTRAHPIGARLTPQLQVGPGVPVSRSPSPVSRSPSRSRSPSADMFVKHGVWQCPLCGSLNNCSGPRSMICSACASQRPLTSVTVAGDWHCPECRHHNYGDRKQCNNPECPTATREWICNSCHYRNHSYHLTCRGSRCNEKNPLAA